MKLKTKVAIVNIENDKLKAKITQLNKDIKVAETKTIIDVVQSLIDFGVRSISWDANKVWSKYLEFRKFQQIHLQWQKYLSCFISYLHRLIRGLKCCSDKLASKPLQDFANDLKGNLKILIQMFLKHKLYTKIIKIELTFFYNLTTHTC